MDTSFWDDDEERLHIVYQDDQLLPPVRTSTDNPGPATTAGRKFDLRGRFAEADLEAAAVVKKSEVDKPRRQADLKADHDKQLHHYASQALEAAAAYAERELLSDIQPNTHEDTIEEVEAQDQQPHLLSPSRQDNARTHQLRLPVSLQPADPELRQGLWLPG
ncbi:hypothetical protein WJX79_008580 [Trebouxia sp. C0005]